MSPVIQACIDLLEGLDPKIETGDATDPDCEKPYAVVTAVSGPRYEGPMDDIEADGRDRIQFSYIGITRVSADILRDRGRVAITRQGLDAQFTAQGEMRRTMRVILDIPRGTRRDERGLPEPVFMGVDQYLIETTPIP